MSLLSQPGSSLHHQVMDSLGRLIASPEYGPGATLPNEEELCERLGVSRTAVREAIKALSAKGMLEARPRTGTRVRPQAQWSLFDADVLGWLCSQGVDQQLGRHLMVMRGILEPAAASLAARMHTDAQLLSLQQAFAAMEAAASIDEWVVADLAFHQSILQATGNPLLISLGGIVASALESLLTVNAQQAGQFNDGLLMHGKVLAAIERRSADDAQLWMRALLADTIARWGAPA
ncbi:MAG: FadR/GntR family transcriptional regulator [Comamonas sp.]|uniref:FadR/GntR family transcriptional regulator n=1 Tax=Comamonas sp. TaxID=34028 RepID=UPI003D107468